MIFSNICCPKCKNSLKEIIDKNYFLCEKCNNHFDRCEFYLNFFQTECEINKITSNAYKIYSKFYAPFALLVYFIIWRGNIIKHIKFFRKILENRNEILDIAIGDGSLSSIALFGKKNFSAKKVIALDISKDMLAKAKAKLSGKPITFILGDVCQLPFKSNSLNAISCFGGFNSFPSGELAMQEIARCLTATGVLRGSVLLTPDKTWKKNLVQQWIKKGYQTEEIDKEKFFIWLHKANLKITKLEQYGDVLLFELQLKELAA